VIRIVLVLAILLAGCSGQKEQIGKVPKDQIRNPKKGTFAEMSVGDEVWATESVFEVDKHGDLYLATFCKPLEAGLHYMPFFSKGKVSKVRRTKDGWEAEIGKDAVFENNGYVRDESIENGNYAKIIRIYR
jgi:hypothetical protein